MILLYPFLAFWILINGLFWQYPERLIYVCSHKVRFWDDYNGYILVFKCFLYLWMIILTLKDTKYKIQPVFGDVCCTMHVVNGEKWANKEQKVMINFGRSLQCPFTLRHFNQKTLGFQAVKQNVYLLYRYKPLILIFEFIKVFWYFFCIYWP